jgi:hypothetical protein
MEALVETAMEHSDILVFGARELQLCLIFNYLIQKM